MNWTSVIFFWWLLFSHRPISFVMTIRDCEQLVKTTATIETGSAREYFPQGRRWWSCSNQCQSRKIVLHLLLDGEGTHPIISSDSILRRE
jgi:hypothetical protein